MVVKEPLPILSRMAIVKYLAGHGWRSEGTRTLDGEIYDLWANHSYKGVFIHVLLPDESSQNYGERVEMMLWNLWMVEKRPESAILEGIQKSMTGE